jgi:murein DD-endopeptidase MepM/ murein hydrolase activator NlpD
MEILVISKSRGTAGAFRLSGFGLTLLALAILSAGAASAYLGFTKGGDDMVEQILNNPERSSKLWHREIIAQRQFLNRLRRDLNADLSAVSRSVGKLQGEVNRLDAVAERVAESSRLDPKEFGFSAPTAVGGPHDSLSELPEWSNLLANLDQLGPEIELRDSRLTALESFLLDKQQRDAAEPVARPVDDGWLSSGFGYRNDPVSGRREFHSGIDFAGKPGLEIRAVAAGVVTWSAQRWGYGNLVEISHGNGYLTRYAHNRTNLVKVGETVEKNQNVALLGSTGRTTGPHLHFEVVHHNKIVNPWKFIRRNAKSKVGNVN